MKKRVLALALACILCLSLLPMAAAADAEVIVEEAPVPEEATLPEDGVCYEDAVLGEAPATDGEAHYHSWCCEATAGQPVYTGWGGGDGMVMPDGSAIYGGVTPGHRVVVCRCGLIMRVYHGDVEEVVTVDQYRHERRCALCGQKRNQAPPHLQRHRHGLLGQLRRDLQYLAVHHLLLSGMGAARNQR